MKYKDLPKFKRFDIVELVYKDQPLNHGKESIVRYIIGYENLKGIETIEVCEKIAGNFAVFPEHIKLESLESLVVHNKK